MRHAFDAALERAAGQETDAFAEPPGLPAIAPPLAEAPEAARGNHSLWEAAAAWTPEADPPPPPPAPPSPPPPPRPSARAEDIAAELGLNRLRTPSELAHERRRFMWNNHPDRRADLDRDLANRRVAVANMLLDRALAALRQRRR